MLVIEHQWQFCPHAMPFRQLLGPLPTLSHAIWCAAIMPRLCCDHAL